MVIFRAFSARTTILRPLLYSNDEHITIWKRSQKFHRTSGRSRNWCFWVKFGRNKKKSPETDMWRHLKETSLRNRPRHFHYKERPNSFFTTLSGNQILLTPCRCLMPKYALMPYSYLEPHVLTGFSLYAASTNRLCASGGVSRAVPSAQI